MGANKARANLAKTKQALLVEISERVEATANKIFKTIQGNHKAIADNYLSLKAYAVTAHSLVKAYVIKGKGKNLSSMGDLLNSLPPSRPSLPPSRRASVLVLT